MFVPNCNAGSSPSLKHHAKRQAGFSMIEVLISIIVLAIGLLGIAGLQLSSLKGTDSANYRSTATMLSYDIVDKMHANRALALAGSYSIALGLALLPRDIHSGY